MPDTPVIAGRALVALAKPGVRVFEPLPAGVDPLNAPNEVLQRYGFPNRPSPQAGRNTIRLWRLAVSRARKHVVPTIVENPKIFHGPARPRATAGSSAGTTNSIWSGKVATGTTFKEVWGRWTVPATFGPPNGGAGQWRLSTWVGLDGWGTDDVLQAGISNDIETDASGNVTSSNVYPWYEWFTSITKMPEQAVTNFPIGPGDSVAIYVAYDGNDQGFASFSNLDRGTYTSINFNRPNDADAFTGTTAEWIVERPSFQDAQGNLQPFNLPDYGIINIADAAAKTTANAFVDATGGSNPAGVSVQSISMTDNAGNVISEQSDEPTVYCAFVGPGPSA